MFKILSIALLTSLISCSVEPNSGSTQLKENTSNIKKPVIVIHGGAGFIDKSTLTEEAYNNYIKSLDFAVEEAYKFLNNGGSAIDAVTLAVVLLENDSLFNAGVGAVLNAKNENELDASIMCGKTLNAGAVSGLKTIKNPIKLAKTVLEKSEHVYLTGSGAEEFAALQGLEIVDNDYFKTKKRIENLKKLKEKNNKDYLSEAWKIGDEKFGTVGAVALDINGNIAAATSTGGMSNKKYGRVGDVPVIGAGTYADNKTCGISCTGHGEYFIRVSVAKEISDRIEFGNQDLLKASTETLAKVKEIGGVGGLIGIDKNAELVYIFNSGSMFRASYNKFGVKEVGVF